MRVAPRRKTVSISPNHLDRRHGSTLRSLDVRGELGGNGGASSGVDGGGGGGGVVRRG